MGFLYASAFSLGSRMFRRMATTAAGTIRYRLWGEEQKVIPVIRIHTAFQQGDHFLPLKDRLASCKPGNVRLQGVIVMDKILFSVCFFRRTEDISALFPGVFYRKISFVSDSVQYIIK